MEELCLGDSIDLLIIEYNKEEFLIRNEIEDLTYN